MEVTMIEGKKSYIISIICFIVIISTSLYSQTWNGGGGTSSWNTGSNWDGELVPTSDASTALIFDGSTQLSANNDISSPFLLNTLSFAATASSFELSGGIIEVYSAIINNSANDQIINNEITFPDNIDIDTSPGNILLKNGITGTTNTLSKLGSGTLTLKNGSSDIQRLLINKGAVILSGETMNIEWADEADLFSGTEAELIITDGAVFDVADTANANDYSRYGKSHCSITVAGTGSEFKHSANVLVLDEDNDSLTISDGAMVTNVARIFSGFGNGNHYCNVMIKNGGNLIMHDIIGNSYIGYGTSHSNTLSIVGTNSLGKPSVINLGGNNHTIAIGRNGTHNKLILGQNALFLHGRISIGTASSTAKYNSMIVTNGAKVLSDNVTFIGSHGSYNTA